MTRAEQRTELLLLANLAANTPQGQLRSGTSSTPTVTTSDAINGWLNEAQRKVSQECYAVRGSGTQAAVSGTSRYDFDAFTVTGGGTLWVIQRLLFNGTPLEFMDPVTFRIRFPDSASGTPLYWTRTGNDQSLEVHPVPTTTDNFTADGLIVPADYASDGASPTWLPAPRHRMLVYAGLEMLAKKNATDERLAAVLPEWKGKYLENAVPLWEGLDFVTRSLFYPVKPS